MFGRITISKTLLVTAISLSLALSEAGSTSQETKPRQPPSDDVGSRPPLYKEGARVATYNTCSEKTASNHKHRDLMIVSTLDGKVSALDLHNAGSVQWTLDTDIGPLMDSSISKLEIVGTDGSYKVIPSLDGGLYRWDGHNVEPVPINADTLMSSSFKLSNDAMMVGGKETSTYGINAGTGQILYICGESGCHMFEENQSKDEDDIIVIQRVQRICRAVEQRTGAEKWNFSVGQHEISYLPGSHDNEDAHHDDDYDDDYQGSVCIEESDEERADSRDLLHPDYKVFISPGTVLAFSENDPTRLLWKKEFSTAIAAVWTIKEGQLKPLDLFDVKNIPLLGADGKVPPSSEFVHPVLYMGEYNKQAYVHPSKTLQQSVNEAATVAAAAAAASQSSSGPGSSNALALPRVQWRPYISTPSRTPIVSNSKRPPWAVDAGSITVWSQYPFDLGYYSLDQQSLLKFHVIGPNKKPAFVDSNDSGSPDDPDGLEILLTVSAAFWWKEILAISLVLALGMQFLCHMLRPGARLERVDSLSFGRVSTQESVFEDTSGGAENQPKEYKSRYLTDFEHQQCLGKGGFGIVFEAKNVVDENSYAVKRICLPNRTQARKKVLREARILARLDHSGIVRYFNSWLEEPPAGWQKQQDDLLLGDSHVNSSQATLLSHSTTANFNKDSLLVRDKEQFLNQTGSHLPTPGGDRDVESDLFIPTVANEDLSRRVGTYLSNLPDESGSFSIEFRDEDDGEAGMNLTPKIDESDYGKSGDSDLKTPVNGPLYLPFKNYSIVPNNHRQPDCETSDSLQVVFETNSTASKSNRANTRNNNTNNCGSESSTSDFSHELSRVSDGHSSKGEAEEPKPCQGVPKVYLYIQMQLCQKETLKDWLGANTLSRDRVKLLHIFQQILGAVEYVHTCGMIHRDLKPSNIFFSAEGTVKVGDFGLVTAVDTQIETLDTLDDDQTSVDSNKKHTSQVGTQLYMSPEQLSGKSYDHKVDIYSLGLIFFELLHPFSTQMERIMVMTGSRQQSFPDRFQKELPKETELIKWLLSNCPMERPDTIDITESTTFKRLYRDFVPPNPLTNRGRYASNSSN
ncbi:eukaryotic translation initiation factor 2-alpha kinase 3-like [Asterias amurensis]|uniref:eukaryotic translation initiation factor 2-alpha kinase 3-like n=1 Tax=Asterias amurensis TaxID=7602 RepID=UPI003AB29A1F